MVRARYRKRLIPPVGMMLRSGQMVGNRLARRAAFSRTRTATQQRRMVSSGQGITTQHDMRRVYMKRNMPRSKKRRYRRFKNKVNAISEKDLGSRTVLINKLTNWENTTLGNQITGALYLYSASGNLADGGNDLKQVANYENTGNPTAAAGITVDQSTKFIFQSGVLDITFRNQSTYFSGTVQEPVYINDSRAKLEVDIYECLMWKESDEDGTSYGRFNDILSQNSQQTHAIGGTGLEIAWNLRGVTPFDCTYSLSRFKVKILKKTKYMVPNGDTFTYQVRDPKRRRIDRRAIDKTEGFNLPGWTRIIYFTAKLVPGLTVGAIPGTFQESLAAGHTTKYLYKIEGANDDRTRMG